MHWWWVIPNKMNWVEINSHCEIERKNGNYYVAITMTSYKFYERWVQVRSYGTKWDKFHVKTNKQYIRFCLKLQIPVLLLYPSLERKGLLNDRSFVFSSYDVDICPSIPLNSQHQIPLLSPWVKFPFATFLWLLPQHIYFKN